MTRTNKIIQSLNAGELSPLMDMRIDQEKYQMGCRTMENFYPLIYGGAERRPGTYYVGEAKDSSAGKIRLVDFIYSVDTAYVLEFGNQYIRIYVNKGRFVGVLQASIVAWATGTKYYAGDFVVDDSAVYGCLITHTSVDDAGDAAGGEPIDAVNGNNTTQWVAASLTTDSYPIYEVSTPYLIADLFELKFEHSADVMYITHPDYEPRKLSRISTTTFVLEELAFSDGPFMEVNAAATAIITPSDTTGSITLTATGTNADGTSFAPFKTGTTAGHAPSGATGGAAAGTSQTLKSITGALFKIIHAIDTNIIEESFNSTNQISDELTVYKGVTWDFITNGIWTGTIDLQRSYDGGGSSGTWETVHTVTSVNNNNEKVDGTEEVDDAQYRMKTSGTWSGTASPCKISVRDTSHIGIVEISAVASTTSATATVIKTLGSDSGTHRWAEGYWSNYRAWPNSVAISPEERLTFAGSPSFPLTIWGTKSGDYTDMTAGTLDDDAVIFTLIGSGRQNAIRWILSKNSLIIGTYGGEHILGASNDKEAMTPTNVTAKIQSTYGSEDIQAIMVGDAILFVQRGGRRLREMHYDFEKDSMVADDLTVFSNHITESTITDIAYQRTPDPMVWCTRDDGELAVLSYERAQNVWSWCRSITSTLAGDSDFESVCIIPSGSEEDIIYVSVERVINGSTVRFIEYFSSRDF